MPPGECPFRADHNDYDGPNVSSTIIFELTNRIGYQMAAAAKEAKPSRPRVFFDITIGGAIFCSCFCLFCASFLLRRVILPFPPFHNSRHYEAFSSFALLRFLFLGVTCFFCDSLVFFLRFLRCPLWPHRFRAVQRYRSQDWFVVFLSSEHMYSGATQHSLSGVSFCSSFHAHTEQLRTSDSSAWVPRLLLARSSTTRV